MRKIQINKILHRENIIVLFLSFPHGMCPERLLDKKDLEKIAPYY